MKKGLLIINLGTPDAPAKYAVKKYLRAFLTDKWVIDLPALLRYMLVYFIIVPFRVNKSVRAYEAIWTEEGSPLLINSNKLCTKLKGTLKDKWEVVLGMRYCSPSLGYALKQLTHCKEIVILPLYPQYSKATVGSCISNVSKLLSLQKNTAKIKIINSYDLIEVFIKAQAALIKDYIPTHDYILFSYHGVPERQIIKAGCKVICKEYCPSLTTENISCYKAQCHYTTAGLAKLLNLTPAQYGMAFQSRLGKIEWLKPYLQEYLPQLRHKGITRLAISCPSFTTDCLETLEEIGLRAKEQWLALKGEKLTLIPCLNDDELWVDGICELINQQDKP